MQIDQIILANISKEVEQQYKCKVLDIRYAQLLSLCVMVKLQFDEDFIWKPFDEMPKPDTICFSERTVSFYKRVDLFDCVKKSTNQN